MPSPRVRAETLVLDVDGRRIEVKKPSRLNYDLNRALSDPTQFQQFVSDPAAFAQRFDLQIDPEIATALRTRLAGLQSLDDVRALPIDESNGATVWAVVSAVYSLSSSKIAVVF